MPRNYVDNASNRSLGRVGMPVGSMPVSRGSSGGGGGGTSSRSVGDGGGISSGYGGGGGYYKYSQSSSSPRTYVDNASNRSLGRVGMPVGSMQVSRRSSGDCDGDISFSQPSCSSRTYVDNASNRSLGHVGMPVGTMPVSRSSGDWDRGIRSDAGNGDAYYGYSQSSSSPRTYVDNASNRSLGRVGMPVGTMVVSKRSSDSGSNTDRGISARAKTYVDNAYNRQHGRVGLEYGTAVNQTSKEANVSLDSGIALSPEVYKDNRLNRKLGRVGKPLGSYVYSKSDRASKSEVYADNPQNRRMGRVGQPRGSMPSSRVSKQTRDVVEIFYKIQKNEDMEYYERSDMVDPAALENAVSLLNKRMEELEWLEERKQTKVKTSKNIFEEYTGTRIHFDELDLHRKIGQGGFGDVYFAIWKGSVVAVKKLRVQRVSRRRRQEFAREVLAFCNLDHPNIVKFIGACLTTPNLCIVMEYMSSSLFEALHMKDDIELTDEEKLEIIQQTCEGLLYLHVNNIAHCDLKSQNVLLDYVAGKTCVAKITDFGLSMIKSNTESSMSGSEQLVRNVGTPRYSAPEVLRGEMMSARAMMAADVYSLGMVIFEIIYEEEPFYNFGYAKLEKQVGEYGVTPEIPCDIKPKHAIKKIMKSCWCFHTSQRPNMEVVSDVFSQQTTLYRL